MKKYLIVVLPLVAAVGCTSKTPLVFVSKTSVGVEVSAPGTGTGEFGASIGVNTLDAAYVPVVERTSKSGENIHQIKSGESLTAEERKHLAKILTDQIGTESNNITALQTTKLRATAAEDKEQVQKDIDSSRRTIQDLSTDLGKVLSRNDALSVFSAFDSNTLLRADSAGQGIGKVFATGLAAQHVARSFNQQALAEAGCKEKIAPTAAKLAATDDQPSKELAIKLLGACE
ncbi:hypothetical protein [Pseudomonas sp. Irchel 3E19]|uniref:hypothetical protein n=1 Tax=Pseudomonas sp. Irchel 3E19 TaxID=2008981 RepID=UPI000BA38941|nr:hypothetical protein [Pseudomonas sp. Irchel 3E19]